MKRIWITLTVLSVALVAPMPAGAQAQAGLQISPAQVEPVGPLNDRRYSGTLTYKNNDEVEYAVSVAVTELGHDLDGTPELIESEEHAEAFSVEPSSFTILPGLSQQVEFSGRIPSDERSMYLAAVATFAPADEGEPGTVEQRSRIAAQYLLRGPKPWKERVEVVDVGFLPGTGDALRVYASLRNTGNVHVKPQGEIEIRHRGKVIDTVQLEGGGERRVLPGYARRLSGAWTPPKGLNGSVKLTARIFEPAATGSATVDFDRGETATPSAEIRNLRARDDDGAAIGMDLVNTGPVTLEDTFVEVVVTEAGSERARRVIPIDRPIEPGQASPVRWRPDLADGTYTVTARAFKGETLLDQASVGLVLGRPPAVPEAPPGAPGTRGESGGSGLLRWLALALIAAMVGATAYLRLRRARALTPPEEAPTRTAVRS